AALQALIITTFGGLTMLSGIIILGEMPGGSYSLSALVSAGLTGPLVNTALTLVLVGAITKSALVPFHFWLPGAMAAPTPVSAYLHAAAMVKAGIYLVARFAPAYAEVPAWRWIVLTLGGYTLLLGGYRALRQYDLKLLLAYGTVSQLGFITLLVGFGTPGTALAGLGLLVSHSLFKSCLFLTTGTLEHATGTRDIRRLSGMGRRMPWLAAGAILAALSMAGVGPVLGFSAKEAAIDSLLHPTGASRRARACGGRVPRGAGLARGGSGARFLGQGGGHRLAAAPDRRVAARRHRGAVGGGGRLGVDLRLRRPVRVGRLRPQGHGAGRRRRPGDQGDPRAAVAPGGGSRRARPGRPGHRRALSRRGEDLHPLHAGLRERLRVAPGAVERLRAGPLGIGGHLDRGDPPVPGQRQDRDAPAPPALPVRGEPHLPARRPRRGPAGAGGHRRLPARFAAVAVGHHPDGAGDAARRPVPARGHLARQPPVVRQPAAGRRRDRRDRRRHRHHPCPAPAPGRVPGQC